MPKLLQLLGIIQGHKFCFRSNLKSSKHGVLLMMKWAFVDLHG
jgi:hypothetical protein